MVICSRCPRPDERPELALVSGVGNKPEQIDPDQNQRVERLEHAAGYADRHIEILSGEVAQLNRALSSVVLRLERLESRLIELNSKVGEEPPHVPPPHSAGPDFPKDPL
jgi:uncharacterized coiled-coil protein SlyX